MLINDNNYLGVNLAPLAYQITNSWLSPHGLPSGFIWSDEDQKLREKVIAGLFQEGGKPYLISKKALQDVELIKIGKNFDWTLLSGIKDQVHTYLINKNLCFRFYIDGDFLRVIVIKKTPLADGKEWLSYSIFWCNTVTNEFSAKDPDFLTEIDLFLKCLIFVEIADSTLEYINSGQKIGSKKDGYYNLLPSKVILVNSNWNKIIIRTVGFSVSGHFRLQRVGEGKKEVKLIWIEPYEKSGYTRLEGKGNSKNPAI